MIRVRVERIVVEDACWTGSTAALRASVAQQVVLAVRCAPGSALHDPASVRDLLTRAVATSIERGGLP